MVRSHLGLYRLDESGEPVRMDDDDLIGWAMAMEEGHRADAFRVAETQHGSAWVSTVFLGLDHNHGRSGPPVLWETMVFGAVLDQYQWRYTSRADAVAGHQAALDLVRACVNDGTAVAGDKVRSNDDA